MTRVFMAAMLVSIGLLLSLPSVFAFERHPGLVSAKRFHACLFSAWVADYCAYHTFDGPSFHACFIANGGHYSRWPCVEAP